jgi:hypothetical protein
MFDFKRLVGKYTKTKPKRQTFTSDGYYDYNNGGVWVDGKASFVEFDGAVLPLGEELRYDNSGFTTDDRKLYTYESVDNNEIIEYDGKEYITMNLKDYKDYDSTLRVLILKAGGVRD